MKHCRVPRLLLALLALAIFLRGTAHLPAAERTTKPAITPVPNTPADLIKAEAEKIKAEAERNKVEVELKKVADARTQFFFDWGYRLGILIAAVLLLMWLIPQVSEISLPWGGGTLSLKRFPKQPLPAGTAPPAVLQPSNFMETTEVLKKALAPGPASDRIVDRLEEVGIYGAVGIAKDAIYVCHHVKKIPRSEYYRISIYLDAEEDAILDKVEKVTYKLHPSFAQPEITRTNRAEQFRLEISAWGEFMLYALVHFKGQQRPIELKRYLNF